MRYIFLILLTLQTCFLESFDFLLMNNSNEPVYVLENFEILADGSINVNTEHARFTKLFGNDKFGEFFRYVDECPMVIYRESFLGSHSWTEIMENNLIDTIIVVRRSEVPRSQKVYIYR